MRGRNLLSIALLAGVATLATAGRASALLQLSIFENGAFKGTAVDNTVGDTNLTLGQLNVDGAFIAGLGLTTANISSLGASTNSTNSDFPGTTDGQLSQAGSITVLTAGTLDIIANDTDYVVPPTQTLMSSVASTSGTNTTGSDTRTFQSYFDPSNTVYAPPAVIPPTGLIGVPSTLITHFLAPVPPSPNQGGYATTVVDPVSNSGTYALSNWTFLSYSPGAGVKTIGWTGQTIITGVPEPTTVALILGGLPLIAVGAWRRRRAA